MHTLSHVRAGFRIFVGSPHILRSHKRSFSRTPTTMVEGHQCHRVAHFHRQRLLGKRFAAQSPNGRFVDGAAAINDKTLVRIECHGKNLFYFFEKPSLGHDDDDDDAAENATQRIQTARALGADTDTVVDGGSSGEAVVLHFHFGMSGAFAIHPLPGPEPKATTRLALIQVEDGVVAHLSAMTVQHGGPAFYEAKVVTLGEDPLREDADAEAAWQKISTSKKPIGLLLMDQSVIAGVGNIYRAEICFKAGISPEQPGNTLTRATWDEIWKHCVLLLQRGFQTGSILTVEPEEATILGPPWTRRYIYNQSKCGRCKGSVQTWDMAGRKVYACVQCQPLVAMDGGGSGGVKGATAVLPAARRKALAAAVTAVEFVSHCAPDDVADVATPPSKLTVAQLKLRLTELGLSTSGNKKALLQRLVTAHHVVAKPEEESPSDGGEETKKVADETVGKNVTEKSPSSPVKLSSLGGVQALTPPVKEASTLRRKRASTSSGVARRGATDRVTALISGNGHPSSSSNGDVDGDNVAVADADAVFPEVYTWDYTTPVRGDADGGNTVKGAVSVRPGIAGVPRERVATAAEAAAEKAEAGENRAVEHVALQDEETMGKVDGMGVGGTHARRTRRRL